MALISQTLDITVIPDPLTVTGDFEYLLQGTQDQTYEREIKRYVPDRTQPGGATAIIPRIRLYTPDDDNNVNSLIDYTNVSVNVPRVTRAPGPVMYGSKMRIYKAPSAEQDSVINYKIHVAGSTGSMTKEEKVASTESIFITFDKNRVLVEAISSTGQRAIKEITSTKPIEEVTLTTFLTKNNSGTKYPAAEAPDLVFVYLPKDSVEPTKDNSSGQLNDNRDILYNGDLAEIVSVQYSYRMDDGKSWTPITNTSPTGEFVYIKEESVGLGVLPKFALRINKNVPPEKTLYINADVKCKNPEIRGEFIVMQLQTQFTTTAVNMGKLHVELLDYTRQCSFNPLHMYCDTFDAKRNINNVKIGDTAKECTLNEPWLKIIKPVLKMGNTIVPTREEYETHLANPNALDLPGDPYQNATGPFANYRWTVEIDDVPVGELTPDAFEIIFPDKSNTWSFAKRKLENGYIYSRYLIFDARFFEKIKIIVESGAYYLTTTLADITQPIDIGISKEFQYDTFIYNRMLSSLRMDISLESAGKLTTRLNDEVRFRCIIGDNGGIIDSTKDEFFLFNWYLMNHRTGFVGYDQLSQSKDPVNRFGINVGNTRNISFIPNKISSSNVPSGLTGNMVIDPQYDITVHAVVDVYKKCSFRIVSNDTPGPVYILDNGSTYIITPEYK